MKLRTVVATAAVSAMALVPTAGHANPGDANNKISATDCTIGDETLAFDLAAGEWKGSANITCATAKPNIVVQWSLVQVQGINIYGAILAGSVKMHSDDGNGNLDVTCPTFPVPPPPCTKVTAFGAAIDIPSNSLYVMTTRGQVDENVYIGGKLTAVERPWSHTTCFLVTGPDSAPTAIPGCMG